jgi:hypothetical protein
MRIVVTLAALSAMFCAASAGRVAAGDESPNAEAAATACPATTQSETDTSVYHLEHAHASELVARVKSLIAQVSAYAADDDVAALPKSLVLLPTSSDDAIIAICPRAQAGIVKDTIHSCDTIKEYAVKVQLFEVTENGRTVPVGGPHLLIGRSGKLECAADGEALSVAFKVDSLLAGTCDAPAQAAAAEAANTEPCAACAAGHCHLDCPPPIGEMAVGAECGACEACTSASCGSESCTSQFGLESCSAESCCADAASSASTCAVCSGKCEACTGKCEACKTGTCQGACCAAGCCKGQSAASCCGTSGCKCDGSCQSGQSAAHSQSATNHEETSTGPTCPGKRFSIGLSFGAGSSGLNLVGPIVWFNNGDEPRCAKCESQADVADSDDGHDADSCHPVPPAPTVLPVVNLQILPVPTGNYIFTTTAPALDPNQTNLTFTLSSEGSCQAAESAAQAQAGDHCGSCSNSCTTVTSDEETAAPTFTSSGWAPLNSCSAQVLTGTINFDHVEICPSGGCDPAKIVKNALTGCKVFTADQDGIRIQQCQPAGHAGSSCTDGCPMLITGQQDATLSPYAPCSCEEPEDGQQAPGAEPPALLTLAQHKEPADALPTPHWQEQIIQSFHGRRLSELFDPQVIQTMSGHEFGRLVAEFPKHPGTTSTGDSTSHGLTIVDLPGCIRIFETSTSTGGHEGGGHEGVVETTKTRVLGTCPNCREEFRAVLEEIFRRDSSEDISQTSHHEGDAKATEAARDLPSVTHSKIATITIAYPLRDLVLCDDAGRPVFDTCTIIDHLQSAVSPETWSHPSVSIQLDQQTVSLVVTQTAEVHQKIAEHLRYLRRLQVKQICNLIERLSGDVAEESADASAQADTVTPTADIELGPALPVGGK